MHGPCEQPVGASGPLDHNSAERIAPSRRSCLPDNLRLYPVSRLEHDRHHPKRQALKRRNTTAGRGNDEEDHAKAGNTAAEK